MILSFSEFLDYYSNHGRCPNDVSERKNKLNHKQLQTRYKTYLKSEEKRQERLFNYCQKDEKWEALKETLNMNFCQLYDSLLRDGRNKEVFEMISNAGHLFDIIDPAHVFGKGAYPKMKYDINNVIPLNRYSHSMLDQNRSPIDGQAISFEEKQNWWKYIIGEELFEKLSQRSKK